MGIEEEQQTSEAIVGVDVVVVQESARDFPAVLIVQELGRAGPADGRGVDGGELVGASPADEVSSGAAVGGGVIGEPTVEVALATSVEGEVVAA